MKFIEILRTTVELHLSGLIGTASHPVMQKIRIIGFFFENGLHWQYEILLSLFTVYLRLNISTTPDLKFQKPLTLYCV
jgi:hypothetical protein